MRITFHGAARQVTGSAHLSGDQRSQHRILLDCGLFDSDRSNPDSPNRSFTFDPRELDAVIVSHAHNDHIGRLPCLVKAGYRGPIFVTRATADITSVMLRDSARIQREDARNGSFNNKNAGVEPIEPLFELTDVEWLVEQFQRLTYDEPTEILPGDHAHLQGRRPYPGLGDHPDRLRRGRQIPAVRLHRRPRAAEHGPPARPDADQGHRHPRLRERPTAARSSSPPTS